MLGPSGIEGLVIATGHHRNGILLTPLTAETISAYILTGRLPETVRPFTPERFGDRHFRSEPKTGRMVAAEVR
jgi:glycine oxidase